MTDLFDITRNRHGGNEFSNEAFESIKGDLTRQQNKVIEFIRKSPLGSTTDEAAHGLPMPHQTASARMTGLKRDKRIVPKIDPETGKQVRRKTRAGKSAGVWIAA